MQSLWFRHKIADSIVPSKMFKYSVINFKQEKKINLLQNLTDKTMLYSLQNLTQSLKAFPQILLFFLTVLVACTLLFAVRAI